MSKHTLQNPIREIVVFRSGSQDKPTLVALLERLVPALLQFSPEHQLWIVEPDRIRYREE